MTAYGRQRQPGKIDPAAMRVALGAFDSFDRADHASNLGATDGSRSADPATWTQASGTWGISGNAAYCPSGGAFRSAWISTGLADNITSIKIGYFGSGNFGFSPRYVDAYNYLWILLAGSIFISSVTSGVNTNHTSGGGHANGDTISVRCVGSSIEVYRNGTLTLTSTRTEHQSATKQALINNGSGFKWDDFSVEAP